MDLSSSTVPLSRRRDKPQLSCSFCRQKKLRCDRQRPCQACTARGAGASCTYPARSAPKSRASLSTTQPSITKRLDSLENTLNSLIQAVNDPALRRPAISFQPTQDNVASATPTAAYTPGSASSGSMHSSSKGTKYVSSAHWMSILDSFSELRECIEQPTRSPAPRPHLLQTKHDVNPVPHLLSVQNITTTRAEILQAMPDRSVVDRHVFAYFNRLSPVFTHRPSFLRQYESFWKNPSAAPVMWVSILYSIMCLMPLEHATSPSSAGDTLSDQSRYLAQVVQCLILGDYSRGGPFTIEALLHYFMVEHSRRRDADTSNWALSGLIIRLALHKGYHREPSLFPNITPYDGELRRRVWMVLYFIDAVISIQMGLPRLIKDEQCDTGFPHNLLDTDFDEDTAALPTPRSDAEITPIQWWVAKYKLLIMIARIADMSLLNIGDGDASSDAKVKQADTLLRATYDQIQPSMKFTSLVNCLGASPETIVGRLSVSLLFLKGLIILHRGYVVGSEPAETRSSFILHNDSAAAPDSARICIEAALQMLEYQDLIYYESQEGGAIASLSWRLRSSSIAHEFFTATSVLCSYMYRVYIRDPGIPQLPQEQIQAIERALVRTHGTWQSQRAVLKDAQTMTEILGLLLAKLQERADGCGTTPRVMDNILDIPLGSGSEDLGALLQDNFGLYGEGMNDFSSFIGW